ncbi:MAG: Bacterial SH3 domain [Rhodobacteraceae bacterium HLUCCA08]|nr:MAG: Bacterial SH3 domain [Rhodobacteraceae bacterium HLUCCA08]
MKTYVWVSFAFMGWAYYEMSGGADFTPETRAPGAETPAPDMVARADTTTLLSVSPSDSPSAAARVTPVALQVDPAPVPEAAIARPAAVDAAPGEARVTLDAPAEAEVTEVITEFVSLSEPQTFYGSTTGAASDNALDLRRVAGSRVNMRDGPGTGFGVIVTLEGGTEVEVLELSDNGWARLRTVSTGQEGWMAERLLTD